MLACEVWDVGPSCWKYPTKSYSSSNWFTKVLKISIYAAVLMVSSKKMGPIMRCRDIPHQKPIFSEWRGSLCTAFGFSFAQISHTTNVLLFKFRCNIFIGVRIIKEMPGSVPSGTHCITNYLAVRIKVIQTTVQVRAVAFLGRAVRCFNIPLTSRNADQYTLRVC